MLIDLRLEGKTVLIFGGGVQGERKAKKIAAHKPRLVVISRDFTEGLLELAERGAVTLIERELDAETDALAALMSEAVLVITATDNHQLNVCIADAARGRGILVCAVDMPEICDFYFPAVAQKGSIRVGLCTNGKSPLMSRLLRQRIEKIITEEDVLQVELQAHARKLAREKIQGWEARREALYRIAGDQEIKRLLADGRLDEAKRIAEKIIET